MLRMKESYFNFALIGISAAFTLVFCLVVVPPMVMEFDILDAFAAGFVNPYASGFSADILFCWAALVIWVVYDARAFNVKLGWVCILLGIVPGVAVGFPLYLVLRNKQIYQVGKSG